MRIRSVALVMGRIRSPEAQAHLQAFGKNVRVLRESRGLTQEKLAEAAGLHRTIVGFIERAEREIGITHLWPLAAALNIEIADLFESVNRG